MANNFNHHAHKDFLEADKRAYSPIGLHPENIIIDKENKAYGALSFQLNHKNIKFRVGKITPTKVGHFVTVWKRENGTTMPHDISDPVDFFIISVREHLHFGQFKFTKNTLQKHDIFSCHHQGGKRGIRVYPPWVETTNKQAQKTQAWQTQYFIPIHLNQTINHKHLKNLLL